MRWDDPQGQPWAVGWNELAAISPMAAALARFAPQVYRGVHTTEGFMGLT